MESKIMVTLPCQFSSSWSSNKCHVCLLGQKHCVSVAARRPFRKSQIHQNFLQAWPWAFSKKKKKKKKKLRNCLCPRGLRGCDSFCLRRELSDVDGSACARRPRTYMYTLHTIHTHTHSIVKESCLAWFVDAGHEEGEAEVKKVESLLLCLGKRAVLELQAVHDQLLWLFGNVRKLLKQELHKSALEHSWSECLSSTSRLIWSPKRLFVDLPVAEKHLNVCATLYLGKENWRPTTTTGSSPQGKRKAALVLIRTVIEWQFLFRNRRKFRYRLGENPRNWGIPFSQPISARLFILAPRPFPGDPVR